MPRYLDEFSERMQEYMKSFGLLSRDAIHLAVAHKLGLTCIASSEDRAGVAGKGRVVP